ncbi:cell surface protein SprA [Chryseolinea sp. T2]|uniref:T9SS outer membrane translocon Sov/SprA n=1 Tax=Chryseolinea sp. T2 TaxID=3129255 RepID=UPI0030773901
MSILLLPDEVFGQEQARPAASDTTGNNQPYQPSRRPTYRATDRYGDPFSNKPSQSPMNLKDPNSMKMDVEIDTSGNYTIREKMGDLDYRAPSTMSFEEYKQYQDREILRNYWKNRSKELDGESSVSGRSLIPKIFISPVLDRIFGGSYVELIPRGFVTLDFGGAWQRINNPAIPIRQQKNGGFEFDQQINMSVVGKIGEKLAVTANFDNNNSFDFQNNMKVEYTGFKEDILQKLEIGNVSLPLNNTLIQGAQNLFGVKAKMQFGKLDVTTIATTQRGKTQSINLGGQSGGQGRPFEIIASNYDENRHFFLGHYFRDNYRNWLANPAQVNSGVNITRVEVYILNRNSETQTLRNVVGLMDLAEPTRIYNTGAVKAIDSNSPNANGANNLFSTVSRFNRNNDAIDTDLTNQGLVGGVDYEKINGARKLAQTEFTFHPQLGYVTLTRKLQNDEALAVAYEYTYNGRAYQVGELSNTYSSLKDDEVVFLKLLRPRKVAIRDVNRRIIPTWDLMMKNIYNLNVNQLSRDQFQLRIIYRDDRTGIDNPQLQEGATVRTRQLVEIMGLDRLNPVNDFQRDGNFDFVEGVTINSTTGLIIFPWLHPFSEALRDAFKGESNESFLIQKYAYDTLYHTTKADAELFATKNKFYIKGLYNAGSAKEILIPGFGVSQGSVKVYAGGIPLNEGTDFVVDYTFSKVTIMNDQILSSGKDIQVQYETSDPFAFQTRSLVGSRFDYHLSEDVNFGGTALYYNERPLISRNQIGTEPARNFQYGLDVNVNKKSRLLTKIVDAIPLIQTKEISSFNFSGEFAQLLPGTSNKINGEGTAYIDDFENTATPYSLMSPFGWKLGSVPRSDDNRFDPSAGAQNDVRAGYNRAKLAWYIVDNQLYRDVGTFKPDNITDEDLKMHYSRPVDPQEIFPKRQLTQGQYYEQIFDVAYYPTERGPNNYNPSLDNSGFLNNPTNNWASITNAIRTEVDFDKANIEYVEFWLLDPFINTNSGYGKIDDGIHAPKSNTTGGQLIFQLGSISEDVMRDGKHAFENGLPADGNLPVGATQNNWGWVTSQQYLTPAFENSTAARPNQDVGYDGMPTEKEVPFYEPTFLNQLSGDARTRAQADPSADNFHYFLGSDLDANDAKILERYKDINGQDGNSPIVSGNSDISPSGSQNPDNEDLNADNTLSEEEAYYQYNVDLKPGQLDIGKKYIVDKITRKGDKSPEEVTWYLFRIPVRQFDSQFGTIDGFKSIKYARMVLTGFAEPVVLRFANFRMVGSRWRRYTDNLRESALIPDPEPGADNFTVNVVNLEENAADGGNKSPYVIPPGVVRDRDNTSSVPRQLNEQSVQVCVDDLQDGDARAIYKNAAADLFNYGRLKMYYHANSLAADNELTAFLRLGTDFDQNFYEIEIPLQISEAGNSDPYEVWPEQNTIDLALNELYALKAQRDREGFPLTELYPREGPKLVDERHSIRIFGRPDLSSVQVMMIGVRNPKTSDKRPISVCMWANELRVTDFDRTAGWAVNSTLSAKLADFAQVNGAIRHTTFGFGGVSSKISERTRDETTAYDLSANVNVDKLIPGNTGIKIPMFLGYQNTTINPNYDPANPDLRIDAALRSFNTDEERSNYLKIIRDQETRKSINFINVRKIKTRPDAVSHLWDIENFSVSYSYSESRRTNFTIAEALTKQYRGSLAYTFTPKAVGIEPFKNSTGLSSPWLRAIKDFNFSFLPSSLGVRFDLNRSFGKNVYRNDGFESAPNYLKYFTFDRQYNMRWNLSKSLSFEYNALANSIIDEPEGEGDTVRTTIIKNLKSFGRMKNFDQRFTVNYAIPLDKFPVTEWLGADYRWQASYNWRAGPLNSPDDENVPGDIPDYLDFRNTIQNARDQNLSGRADLVKLYNKVKFLKELNTPPRQVSTRPGQNPKVPVRPDPKADTVKKAGIPPLVKGLLRILMSVRSVNGTYSLTEGTTLPGYDRTPKFLGMDDGWHSPGFGFILGSQDPNIRYDLADRSMLTYNTTLTNPFTQRRDQAINLRANVEPSPDFKIQLDMKKETTNIYQEIFRYNDSDTLQGYASLSPSRGGAYRISFIAVKTVFEKSNDEVDSKVFHQFEDNLDIIKERFRLMQDNPNAEFDTAAQDVLIPAFIAAYSGKDARSMSLSPFPKTPLPNWRIDYTGLSKIPAIKNIFQSVTLSHAYQSTYSVSNYSNALDYSSKYMDNLQINRPVEDYNNKYFATVSGNKLMPVYVISQVLISESFAPLIGINVRTKSRVTANFQYKTKRDLALNISNAQITELNTKDVSLELGFTKNNMKLPFKSQGRLIVLKNDLTFRLNGSIADTKTIQRKINELNTVTNGSINYQLRPNISYVVNQKLNVQLYYERTINDPLVSNSYRRATTRVGAQIRFSLSQ